MANEVSVVEKEKQLRINKLKGIISSEAIQKRFSEMLGDSKATFLASVLDLYTSDNALSSCDPNRVMMEAIKAATLKLPINKSLGFAYIVPYKSTPTFMLGYRGLVQLAMRTGQYKHINADVVYEGERVINNRVTGSVEITGEKTSDKAIGYFAYIEMLNGFSKAIFWTKERVVEHAKRYSKTWSSNSSPWQTDFDSMACKTLLRNILSKYGYMSVDFIKAMSSDIGDRVDNEMEQNANKEVVSFDSVVLDSDTGEILNDSQDLGENPGF